MDKNKKRFTKRFFPAGNYNWIVPDGCTEVDVFLVGGGGGGGYSGGGGSGYTKTYKKDITGWRDGGSLSVTPGQTIPIIVGRGGGGDVVGGHSQFLNSTYRANGGLVNNYGHGGDGGNGGSGGGAYSQSGRPDGGSDGSNGIANSGHIAGTGQGHTTRDFGEPTGNRNAGGGAARGIDGGVSGLGGVSDYSTGGGSGLGGGGYGGGGGGGKMTGGDGTVLIRYYAYSE